MIIVCRREVRVGTALRSFGLAVPTDDPLSLALKKGKSDLQHDFGGRSVKFGRKFPRFLTRNDRYGINRRPTRFLSIESEPTGHDSAAGKIHDLELCTAFVVVADENDTINLSKDLFRHTSAYMAGQKQVQA
ncbi:hypothetical protein Q0M94_12125 [Deinococcus radiomollis]|uniref:hypothetical protein n=1 Tax=Deinococcus radiomollis TaxID=468916 RepID=UPI0038912E09